MRPGLVIRPAVRKRLVRPAASGTRRSEVRAGSELAWKVAQALIHGRQNVAPKRLEAPGPDPEQLDRLLQAAAAAPDHGRLTPWRFVLVPTDKRARLAEAFAAALLERDPAAGPDELAQARDKAFRAPLLVLAVARLGPAHPDTPALERVVSLGCAIQNLLLAAQALGYGCGLASGQAMGSSALRGLFRLAPREEAVCFIGVGTVREHRPARPRPKPADFLSSL